MSPKLKVALWATIALAAVALGTPIVFSKASSIPFLLGLIALAAAVTIPIVLGRRRLSFMTAWLAVYVAVYVVLSWRGGYVGHNLGGADNRETWFPAHCGESYISRVGRRKAHLNALGSFFFPLVAFDRMLVHRTRSGAW